MAEPNGNGDGGQGGDGNSAPDANAWKTSLAGDNAEWGKLVEGYADTAALFTDLAKAKTPPVTDWRKIVAGDNADRAKKLERFTDPSAFFDSFEQKENYIATGRKVTVPEEGATPEVVDAWNKARGVPDAPDGYQITAKAPEGLEVGEANQALLKGVTQELHKLGAEPAIVNFAHDFVYRQIAAQQESQRGEMEGGGQAALKALEKVWPNKEERAANLNWAMAAAYQFVGPKGSPELESFSNLQVFDGERYWRLGDHPEVARVFAKIGRASAEDPIFLEASGVGGGGKSLEDQIKDIMALRGSDMRKYNAPETQEKLSKLIAARQRHEALQGRRSAA